MFKPDKGRLEIQQRLIPQSGEYLVPQGTQKPESSRRIEIWVDKMGGIYKQEKTNLKFHADRIQP